MQERRRFKRLDINLPVTLRYQGRLIPATALNISCGGMCVATDTSELDVSDSGNVEVVIDLSSAELDVSVRGKVVRAAAGKGPLGIQFTNLFSVGNKAIERFITKNKS